MLAETRQAVIDALSVIPDVQWSPYLLSNPTPPTGWVYPDNVDYDQTMARGLDLWLFTLQVFLAETGDQAPQIKLDQMIEPSGPLSVKAALGTDRSLGGVVSDCLVTSCAGYRRYADQGRGPLVGSEWTLTIRARGDGG